MIKKGKVKKIKKKREQEKKTMKGQGRKEKIKGEKCAANEIVKLSTKKEIKQNKIL